MHTISLPPLTWLTLGTWGRTRQLNQTLTPYATVTDLRVWRISGHHYGAIISWGDGSHTSYEEHKHVLEKFDTIHHLMLSCLEKMNREF